MGKLSYREMVKAMRAKDASYNGRFYVGVHSTGIYCLPSCKAKSPLLKNVVFYQTREEAIAAGLRGCRRCKSQQYPNVLPGWLFDVLARMRDRRDEKLSEQQLMLMTGVEISTVRRYFKAEMGSTPLAFHRRVRLQLARQLLEHGSDYLSVTYACGYESASGFRDAFIREFGITPGRYYARHKNRFS